MIYCENITGDQNTLLLIGVRWITSIRVRESTNCKRIAI